MKSTGNCWFSFCNNFFKQLQKKRAVWLIDISREESQDTKSAAEISVLSADEVMQNKHTAAFWAGCLGKASKKSEYFTVSVTVKYAFFYASPKHTIERLVSKRSNSNFIKHLWHLHSPKEAQLDRWSAWTCHLPRNNLCNQSFPNKYHSSRKSEFFEEKVIQERHFPIMG